jgi:glycine/D-amino acid oxidase-like deaminating enzyme
MRVAVLGAGLQGACVALELARRSARVDLYERQDAALTQASSNNEGKLHLGYVYAHDPTGQTARAMVSGALSFAALLRQWIGSRVDELQASTPFSYALHRDSLIDADTLERHLARCARFVHDIRDGQPADYFGSECRERPRRLTGSQIERAYDPERITAAFSTPEVSIDPEALAREVRARLSAEAAITCRFGATVTGVDRNGSQPVVRFDAGGARHDEAYDHVVNALWTNRLEVDATAGVVPTQPWLFRLKRFIRVRGGAAAAEVTSTTIVLGPFGDVTRYADGDLYLSWYPAALGGISSARQPPDWRPQPAADERPALRRAIMDGLTAIVPALSAIKNGAVEQADVGGGVIFAWGASDIDDPASQLHARTAIGPESFGRYHTVNTGKFTTAPLFAKVTADRVMAQEAHRG